MRKAFCPTATQVNVLRKFQEQFGNKWKAVLRECWHNPHSDGALWAKSNGYYNTLLYIRNQAGEDWLVKFNIATSIRRVKSENNFKFA